MLNLWLKHLPKAEVQVSLSDIRTLLRKAEPVTEKTGNGGLDILTSCNVISEGTDIPVVTCGILMRPTESLSLLCSKLVEF